ncbi:MAG: lipocalin-like domain-containing protein [Paludibaculum sp.]
MRTLLNLRVILFVPLLLAATAIGQERAGGTARFAGAWRLLKLEQPGADGKPHVVDCTGLFIFTSDGHASVQVMERNPAASHGTGPQQYSQGGYEASWGTYTVDERSGTFTFHIEGALVRSLVGKDLPRSYQFSGNRLTVKSTRPDEHWSVTWQRE